MNALVKAGLVLLLACTANCSFGKTLYVQKWGDDGTGDGSKTNPYQTIQAAINNSVAKGRIVVGPGLYEESITIALEGLKVESESGARSTIIDAGGGAANTVEITSNKVAFGKKYKGFTIQGATGVGLIYTDGAAGAASGGKVEGNISYNNGTRGFEIYCNNATIKENEANKNTTDGYWCGGDKVKLEKNFALGNSQRGFSINSFTNGKVSGNRSRDSGFEAFLFSSSSSSNTIKDNLAYDSGDIGFSITGGSQNNKVIGNTSERSTGSGFFVADGTGLIFQKNIATSNTVVGILIIGGNPKVESNTSVNNGDDGINIGSYTNLIVKGNTIVSNIDIGLLLSAGTSVDKVEQNNIFGNDVDNNFGLDNAFSGLTPMKNFWGSTAGPGADPADTTNDVGAGSTTINKPSTKMHKVKTADKLH